MFVNLLLRTCQQQGLELDKLAVYTDVTKKEAAQGTRHGPRHMRGEV